MCMLYKIINLYKFVIYSRHLAIVKCLIFIKGGNLMNNYSVEHESTFSRNVANIGKAGAYYTDTEHCRRIGKLIKFPAEFNLLEPNVIRSAITGAELIKPKDLSHLVAGGKLLNKERELVSLVEKELGEDRNCVIYCEFTNSSETIITQRIKQVLFEKVAGLEEEQDRKSVV